MISETRSNFVLEHGEMEANQRSQKRLWACVVFLLVTTYVQTVSILLRDSFETALPCFSLLRVFIAAPEFLRAVHCQRCREGIACIPRLSGRLGREGDPLEGGWRKSGHDS